MAVDVVDVKWLQTALNTAINARLVVDGLAGALTRGAIAKFQISNALPSNGIADTNTVATLSQKAGVGALKTSQVWRGVAIHGLGDVFSPGMDSLAGALNKLPNVTISVLNEGSFFYDNRDAITNMLETAWNAGARLIGIGHSMGADELWQIAGAFAAAGKPIEFDLICTFDPTDWGSQTGGTPGHWLVPHNVKVAGNFWQPSAPGGGQIALAPGNTTSKITQQQRPGPHAGVFSVPGIDSDPVGQAWVVEQASALVGVTPPNPFATPYAGSNLTPVPANLLALLIKLATTFLAFDPQFAAIVSAANIILPLLEQPRSAEPQAGVLLETAASLVTHSLNTGQTQQSSLANAQEALAKLGASRRVDIIGWLLDLARGAS